MVATQYREDQIYQAIESGLLTIDSQGRVWRVATRRRNRWNPQTHTTACTPRRAENSTGTYLQVRVMTDGMRIHALAHRLVWRHFFGPIPPGQTVNHKNGVKWDNRPGNLELATMREQQIHARKVLRRGRLNQWGPLNRMAKLTTEQVREICARRANGELIRVLAADYGVREQTISRIARGDRRSLG